MPPRPPYGTKPKKPKELEERFIEAYIEHLGDLGLVSEALQIEPSEARSLYVRPLVRQWIIGRMIQREQKWRGIGELCKGALVHAMTAPNIASRERVQAAKVGLDAIVRGNMCDLRDIHVSRAADDAFEAAIDDALGEGAVKSAVKETVN